MKFNLITLATSFSLASLVVASPNTMAAVARDAQGDPNHADHKHRHHRIKCDDQRFQDRCNQYTCDDNYVHEGHWDNDCNKHCDCDPSDYHYNFMAM